ncbi:MAG: hypothetical protein ACYS30_19990 [Planctomycetota bacterium]|jgi:hypothetical protein
MNIDELTIGEAKEIVSLINQPIEKPHPWIIGQAYHIETVTKYWTGRLVAVYPDELIFEDAAWVASTGRYADFFSAGPDEVEPVPGPVGIGRGAIASWQEWTIALPRVQK